MFGVYFENEAYEPELIQDKKISFGIKNDEIILSEDSKSDSEPELKIKIKSKNDDLLNFWQAKMRH